MKPFSSAQNSWDKFPKQFKRTYKRSDGLKQEKLHHAKLISSEERVDRVGATDAMLISQAMAVWPFPVRKPRKSLKGLREGSVPSWTRCILGRERWQQMLHPRLSNIVCSGASLLMGLLIATAGQRPTLILFANDKKLQGLQRAGFEFKMLSTLRENGLGKYKRKEKRNSTRKRSRSWS